MGFNSFSWELLLFGVLTFLSLKPHCGVSSSDISVIFSNTPLKISSSSTAVFMFDVFEGRGSCRNCSIKCKLDDQVSSNCEARNVSYIDLHDGDHAFEVCINGLQGPGCASYNWTVDTIPPTASVTVASAFTNALNFSVDISFSEVCSGAGGFGCTSVNACNLLVYGPGQVIPSTLKVLQPDLRFSLLVSLSSGVQYGRVILVMDTNFCTDPAGNIFNRTENSVFFVHFDKRSVFANLRAHIPEKLLQLNGETRTIEATNNPKYLKIYLNFSEPVLNSSAEILKSLHTSEGVLLPSNGKTNGNRRFGFLVQNISKMSVVTITFDSNSTISRQGTAVSPVAPITFLYDSQRPSVRLSTTSKMRTSDQSFPVTIKFIKPVFGFNSSTLLLYGGHLQSFVEVSRSIYMVHIVPNHTTISVSVPENITADVAGNNNLASNILQLRHYSVPTISTVFSIFTTATFAGTSLAAGLLTISTSSLQFFGVLSSPSSLMVNPARNLFRIACHIQVFALSRWLAVTLPVEFYEFARGLKWSIPYLSLPWETEHIEAVMVDSSPSFATHFDMYKEQESGIARSKSMEDGNMGMGRPVFGLPLTPMEYRSFFESHNIKPQAEDIFVRQSSDGWDDFARNMFWLGVICGSLILLHALLLLLLRCRRKNSEERKPYGALIFPRLEIFLIILALPCICQASMALAKGGRIGPAIVGILLLGAAAFLLLALLVFLSVGITFGKLLQYKEVHQEGKKFHWYQEIVRVTLGPGKKGQWTWKDQPNASPLTMFGPLFEDLRGPPKYMLSQISGGSSSKHADSIIASDDETEDAEAPFIQKLFGILRIYYTLLESVRRLVLGIMAGLYMNRGSSRIPTVVLLCLTSFQLSFILLKKPFIKKKVQLVEILSLASEVAFFATCLALLQKKFSSETETKIGIFMLLLFLMAFMAQMINEWYALYRQILRLNPMEKLLLSGLKRAGFGLLMILIPHSLLKNMKDEILQDQQMNRGGRDTSSGDQYRSSGSRSSGNTDKPWIKQLRELAKASFSKDETRVQHDPSSSTGKSGFWGGKRSESSSITSSSDFKSKSKSKTRSLNRDMEAIFSSK